MFVVSQFGESPVDYRTSPLIVQWVQDFLQRPYSNLKQLQDELYPNNNYIYVEEVIQGPVFLTLVQQGFFYMPIQQTEISSQVKIVLPSEYVEAFRLSAYAHKECFCKYEFLQCPLVSFTLLSKDSRLWLEQDKEVGVQSTNLVINATEAFESTVHLRAHFMNVRNSPSISLIIKVSDLVGTMLQSGSTGLKINFFNDLRMCTNFSQDILFNEPLHFDILYGAMGEESSVKLQSWVSDTILTCSQQYLVGFSVANATNPEYTLRSPSCQRSECLAVDINASQVSTGSFLFVATIKDPENNEEQDILVFNNVSVGVTLGTPGTVSQMDMPAQISLLKNSGRLVPLPPIFINEQPAAFQALSSSATEMTPVSSKIELSTDARHISVDTSSITNQPTSFYIYARSSAVSETTNLPFFGFTEQIQVRVVCDDEFEAQPFLKQYLQESKDEPISIPRSEYETFFPHVNQACTSEFALASDEKGHSMTERTGKGYVSLDQSGAIVVTPPTSKLQTTFVFYLQATREDGRKAFQKISTSLIGESVISFNAEQVDVQLQLNFEDSKPTDLDSPVIWSSSAQLVQASIPKLIKPSLLVQEDDGKVLLVFNRQASSLRMEGLHEIRIQVRDQTLQANLIIIIKLEIIINRITEKSQEKREPETVTGAARHKTQPMVSVLSGRRVIWPSEPDGIQLISVEQANQAMEGWRQNLQELRAPGRGLSMALSPDSREVQVLIEPSGRLQVTFPFNLLRPSFFSRESRTLRTQGEMTKFAPYQFNVARDMMEVAYLQSTYTEQPQSFSVVLEEWRTNGPVFSINFSNPLQVSRGDTSDQLSVSLWNTELLIGRQTLTPIDTNLSFTVDLPNLLLQGANYHEMKSHAQFLRAVIESVGILGLLLLIYLDSAPQVLVDGAVAMQLVLLVSVWSLELPANLLVYLPPLYGAVNLESFQVLTSYMDHDQDLNPFGQTNDIWVNLGPYFAGILLLACTTTIFRIRKNQTLTKTAFEEWHRLLFLHIIISVLLAPADQKIASYGLGALIAGALCASFCFKWPSVLWLFRSLLLALMAFVPITNNYPKIVLSILCNLFYHVYTLKRLKGTMQTLNEALVLLSAYMLLGFTPLVPDPVDQYVLGEAYVDLIQVLMISNACLIGMAIRKAFARRVLKNKKSKLAKQAQLNRQEKQLQRAKAGLDLHLLNQRWRKERLHLDVFRSDSTVSLKDSPRVHLSAIPEAPDMDETDQEELHTKAPESKEITAQIQAAETSIRFTITKKNIIRKVTCEKDGNPFTIQKIMLPVGNQTSSQEFRFIDNRPTQIKRTVVNQILRPIDEESQAMQRDEIVSGDAPYRERIPES